MELRQLRQIITLAETLNFHRAAERLHMAQPPLSASVRKLEEELGISLFERKPSGLKITPAGKVVLLHAQKTLFFANELRRSAQEGASGIQGRLDIGFVGSTTHALLPLIIPAFRKLYPKVELTLEESTTAELIGRLNDNSLDIALLRLPIFEPCSASITVIERDHLVLVVDANSELAKRDSVSLAELGAESFIIYSKARAPNMHNLTRLAFSAAEIAPHISQEAVQVQTICSLVKSGLGVALVPSIPACQAGAGIKVLALDDHTAALELSVGLATPPDADSPVVKNFVDVATKASCGMRAAG